MGNLNYLEEDEKQHTIEPEHVLRSLLFLNRCLTDPYDSDVRASCIRHC